MLPLVLGQVRLLALPLALALPPAQAIPLSAGAGDSPSAGAAASAIKAEAARERHLGEQLWRALGKLAFYCSDRLLFF